MKQHLSTFLLVAASVACGFGIGILKGYNNARTGLIEIGKQEGINIALDTVNKIMSKQVHSDSTISKVTFVNKDTVTYFLSNKTIIK